MEKDNVIELQIKKSEQELLKEDKTKSVVSNASNPIYKKMLEFHNTKIGEKFSIKDLLR
ncbi:hypothetical protein IJG72_00480 [bacterium]|nr:hypothetical protein [bacterium]